MSYKVFFAHSFEYELKLALTQIELNYGEIKARSFTEELFKKIEILEDFPYIGKQFYNSIFNYENFRYIFFNNMVLFYIVNDEKKTVSFITVLSHYQNYQKIINKAIMSLKKVLIEDERLSLVYLDRSMYYDIYINSHSTDNEKYVPDEVFHTLEEASDVVDYLISCYQNEDGPFVYAIIRKIDNANIGYVQLVKIDEGWEIGYHIKESETGKGYATRSAKLFLDYLKDNTSIDQIYGVALQANKASVKVLSKLGFVEVFRGTAPYQGKPRKIVKTIYKLR